VAGFYTARSRPIPPLPWQTFAPPFSEPTAAPYLCRNARGAKADRRMYFVATDE